MNANGANLSGRLRGFEPSFRSCAEPGNTGDWGKVIDTIEKNPKRMTESAPRLVTSRPCVHFLIMVQLDPSIHRYPYLAKFRVLSRI